MAEVKEADFTFMGIRFRTMDMLPAGAMMICDGENTPKAIYDPGKGWRVVTAEALRDAHQIIFSKEGLAELAKAAARAACSPETPGDEA